MMDEYFDFEKLKGKNCDVCGQPAKDYKQDILQVPSDEPFDRKSANGKHYRGGILIHYGCELHPPITACYSLDGTICPQTPTGFEILTMDGSIIYDSTFDSRSGTPWKRLKA